MIPIITAVLISQFGVRKVVRHQRLYFITTMAPNPAVSTHELTENVIKGKLQGDRGPTDKQTASIARCSARTIRRHRRNVLLYGATKAPSNGAGRPKTVKPPIDNLPIYTVLGLLEKKLKSMPSLSRSCCC